MVDNLNNNGFQPTVDNLNNINANTLSIDGSIINFSNYYDKTSDSSDVITEGKTNKFDHITSSAPIIRTGYNLAIAQSDTKTDGYLSSTDWNTFNNKGEVLTFSTPLSKLLSNVTIAQSDTKTDGYLTSTNWNTFNNKENVLTFTSPLKRTTNNIEILPFSIYWSNVIRVDKNGDDSKGSVGGYPCQTITQAMSIAAANDLIYIGIGEFVESLTMKDNVHLRGIDRRFSIISNTSASSGSLITMGSGNFIECLYLKYSGTADGISVNTVKYTSTSLTTSFINLCTIECSASAGATNVSTAIYSDSTGSTPHQLDTIKNSNIFTSGSANQSYGVRQTGAGRIILRNAHINTDDYGVSCEHKSGEIFMSNVDISGGTTDISQSLGIIDVSACTLQHKTANGYGFTAHSSQPLIIFGGYGAINSGTRYLWFGSQVDDANEITVVLTNSYIINNITAKSRTAITVGKSLVCQVRKNNANTSVSCTITAGNTSASNSSVSVDYTSGDEISLQITTNGGGSSGATDLTVCIEGF